MYDITSKETVTLTNSRGQTFIKGAFYAIMTHGGRLQASRRVNAPKDFTIADGPDKCFKLCKTPGKEMTGLVLLGEVVSYEDATTVKTKRGAMVPMREYMMNFRTAKGDFKTMPVTVWGKLAAKPPTVAAVAQQFLRRTHRV